MKTSLFTKEHRLILLAAIVLTIFTAIVTQVLVRREELSQTDSSFAAGTTLYVDCTAGNDNNNGTSESTAWKSISKANSATLTAGDKLLFKKGCTWTGPLTAKWTGNNAANVIIDSYGSGALPIIQNAQDNIIITGSYITIQNIKTRADAVRTDNNCKNPNGQGQKVGFRSGIRFQSGAAYNTIQNSEVTELAFGVFITEGAHHNKVLNNKIYDNTMMSALTSGGDDDSGAFGVAIHGNENEIAYNTISGQDACSYDYERDGSAVEIYGGQRNSIHHNIAHNNDAFTELGKAGTADNIFAYNKVTSNLPNSLFLNTRGGGTFGPVTGTKAYNNTVYITGAQGQGVVCSDCGPNILTLRNNIIWANWKTIYTSAPFNESNNIYWKAGGNPLLQLFGGATLSNTSKKVDPQFVNASSDLSLKSTSPAFDAGSNESVAAGFTKDLANATVPQGSGVDIGAYEYRSTTSSPSTSQTPTPATASPKPSAPSTPPPASSGSVTLIGAGDAGRCQRVQDNMTAKIIKDVIASKPAGSVRVYYGGDVYEQGTTEEMNKCYGGSEYGLPAWGDFKDLTWPIIGDHEQQTSKGTKATAGYPYYDYWGYPASGQHPKGLGERQKGWYSKDFGEWHLVFLNLTNTSCTIIPCDPGSEEYNWFRSDLEKNAASGDKPTMVIMHHTYWSLSNPGGRQLYRPLMDLMYQHGVEVLLQHDIHNFQALNPMRPDTTLDSQFGIRSFVVGFGGAPTVTSPFNMTRDRIAHTNFPDNGVIEFTLNKSDYSWRIRTINNGDNWSGSDKVHGRPGGGSTTQPSTTKPSSSPRSAVPLPTPAPQNGLQASYFNNKDLTSLATTRIDPAVNFNWQKDAPRGVNNAETFSVRWTGSVQPRYSQRYTFYARTDDGVRVWINNQQIINAWRDKGADEVTGSIALTANQLYPIKVEYYDNQYNASAQLYWSSTSQTKQIVPTSRLFVK